MTASTLHLKFAERHVQSFADESRHMEDHRDAMNCLDCEAFLQLGIDAFDWLVRADLAYRKTLADEPERFDAAFETSLEALFQNWLGPCAFANRWIAALEQRGFSLDNLGRFRKCEAEVRSLVKFLGDDQMTAPLRSLRDQATAEHRNGETAEFI